MDMDALRLEINYTAALNERSRMILDLYQQIQLLQQENAELNVKLKHFQALSVEDGESIPNSETALA